MGNTIKGLAILGSTGSIGTQTLDIVRSFPKDFKVVALAAGNNIRLLHSQAKEFHPKLISSASTESNHPSLSSLDSTICSMEEMAVDPEVDLVVTSTVEEYSLNATISAIKAGKNIALANKESIVAAGELITKLAKKHNVEILPIDSEPSAIWQCLRGEENTVSKLIITASGGAFRGATPNQLINVTPKEALKHPTWEMGRKITIDSATLMNKAFEVVEAHWLFGIPWENIEVIIHPQSIIHSMVEFVDGSVKAQMSPPDMRLPIQYALFYPHRIFNDRIPRFDPISTGSLTFEKLNSENYPCFEIGLKSIMKGGTWGAAVCGADSSAVDLFLSERIGYLDIPKIIQEIVKQHTPIMTPSINNIMSTMSWARNQALNNSKG